MARRIPEPIYKKTGGPRAGELLDLFAAFTIAGIFALFSPMFLSYAKKDPVAIGIFVSMVSLLIFVFVHGYYRYGKQRKVALLEYVKRISNLIEGWAQISYYKGVFRLKERPSDLLRIDWLSWTPGVVHGEFKGIMIDDRHLDQKLSCEPHFDDRGKWHFYAKKGGELAEIVCDTLNSRDVMKKFHEDPDLSISITYKKVSFEVVERDEKVPMRGWIITFHAVPPYKAKRIVQLMHEILTIISEATSKN